MKKYSVSSICAFAILVGGMALLPVKQAEAGFGCWAQGLVNTLSSPWGGGIVVSFSDDLGFQWSFCLVT